MAFSFISIVFLLTLISLVDSNGRFIGTPQNRDDLKAALKGQIDLKCQYSGAPGDDDGQFLEWYKDNIPVSSEKPGHYTVKTDKSETKLSIKVFVKNDSLVRTWYVKTRKTYNYGVACRFGPINLIPSPQSIRADDEVLDTSDSSVRRKEGGSVSLTCNIEPNQYRPEQIKWEYSNNNRDYTPVLPDGIGRREGNLSIPQVQKTHRGYYRCTVNNKPFTVLLRVKDQYAALWPFLGIVGVVTILVLIILIFEKRQKASRKAAATSDEDNTKDPLVRSGNKSSDNDNKKRAVKA